MSESRLTLEEDEYQALMALSGTLDALAALFENDEESVPGLRMSIATIRTAADLLEGVADRWEGAA